MFQLRQSFLLFLTATIWGSGFVAQSIGMDHVTPFTYTFFRTFIGAIVLLPVIYWLHQRKRSDQKQSERPAPHYQRKDLIIGSICCGICLVGGESFQQFGLVTTDAGKAGSGAAVALLMKALMYQATPGIQSEKWEEMVRLGQYFVDGVSMTYADMLQWDSSQEDWEALRKRLWFKPQELNSPTDPYEEPTSALQTQDENTSEAARSAGFTNEGGYVFDDMYSTSPVIWSTDNILTEIFGSDPRRSYNLGHQTYTPDGELCQCGPGKFVSLKWYTPVKERPQNGGDNGKNRRYLRYADVVLMYAEALNECGNGAAALEQLNKCKAQVNTLNNSSTLYIGGGYGYMRDQIWEERRKELVKQVKKMAEECKVTVRNARRDTIDGIKKLKNDMIPLK